MREISFRAWDEKNQRWLHGYGENRTACDIFGETIVCGGWMMEVWKDNEAYNKTIIEQFTGFLDSEKTKIFEGDILTQSTEHIVYRKYMVIWQNGAWMCIELKYGITMYLNELRLENWKVIGNRHDNKELLNGV